MTKPRVPISSSLFASSDITQERLKMPKAITISPSVVYYSLNSPDVPQHTPKADEVLLKVVAATLNHRDLYIRQNLYPAISPPEPPSCGRPRHCSPTPRPGGRSPEVFCRTARRYQTRHRMGVEFLRARGRFFCYWWRVDHNAGSAGYTAGTDGRPCG